MDPITMMVASVGLQFFNNYATSKKNKEIQAKQREFQKATAEHDFERARKAQAEAARIALELEAEVHQERVEDIQKNYDSLLENFAHGFAISNWPLNVLPFVMKGESFGSLIAGTAKSISMHCVFTPSNCVWFNEFFYDDLDSRVEAEMNNNWNSQSTHPIVYYGGGWNRRENKHGISIPSLIDLDDIALLKNKLKNIPTMVITPFFDPYLHFKVQLWGMGKDSDMPFRIDMPNKEMGDNNRIFTFDYNKDSTPEFSESFYNTTTKEFVAYLVSLIGFMADKYFWSMYGVKPYLPSNMSQTIGILPAYYADLYEEELRSYTEQDYYDDIKAIDLCSAIGSQTTDSGIVKIVSDHFAKNSYEYNYGRSIDENVLSGKVYVDDLMFLVKLAENNFISKETLDIVKKNVRVNDFLYVLNVSELFDIIVHDYGYYDEYVFVIKDNSLCVGYLMKNGFAKQSVVSVLHQSAKSSDCVYRFLINRKLVITSNQDETIKFFPENVDINDFESYIIKHSQCVEKQIEMGDRIYAENQSLLENAREERVNYHTIRNWIRENDVQQSTKILVVRSIHKDKYYLLLHIIDTHDNVLKEQVFSMFSVDQSVISMMKNKIILTINSK